MTLLNWVLDIPHGTVIGYDGENDVYDINITTDASDSWDFYLDIEYSNKTKGTLPLVLTDGVLTATVKQAYLKAGYAGVQIRAVDGDKVKKSNISTIVIKRSVNATEELTATPVEWEVYEKQIAAIRDEAKTAANVAVTSAETAEDARDTTISSAQAAKESEDAAKSEADIATEAATRASQSVGQVSWAYFKVDDNGRLQMNRAESYKEPIFSITDGGRLEVIYGEN